ncbi:hypothetical protein CPAV1605_839 [seawater metagenome]|uniref:Uncharacterized protein n=1 Tax=seawater metagenome TaxID=1561972 RepID=A0A5E8CKB2_9ZZZZ
MQERSSKTKVDINSWVSNSIYDILSQLISESTLKKISNNNFKKCNINSNGQYINLDVDLNKCIGINFIEIKKSLIQDAFVNSLIVNLKKNIPRVNTKESQNINDMYSKIIDILKNNIKDDFIKECCYNFNNINEFTVGHVNNKENTYVIIRENNFSRLIEKFKECICNTQVIDQINECISDSLSEKTINLIINNDSLSYSSKKTFLKKYKLPVIIISCIIFFLIISYLLKSKKKIENKQKYINVASIGKNIVRKINDNATELSSDLDSFSLSTIN